MAIHKNVLSNHQSPIIIPSPESFVHYQWGSNVEEDAIIFSDITKMPIKTIFCNIDENTTEKDISDYLRLYLNGQVNVEDDNDIFYPHFTISQMVDEKNHDKVYGYIFTMAPIKATEIDKYDYFRLSDIPNLKETIIAIKEANKENIPIFIYHIKDLKNSNPGVNNCDISEI